MSGNLGSLLGEVGKTIIKDEIIGAGVASGTALGASDDSFIGFADGGLLTGMGADKGKTISTDMANRLTSDTNTSPDRIIYFGDPISALGFNAQAVMPSFKQGFNNSARSCSGLLIKGAVPIHGTPKNSLTQSPDDSKAKVVTYKIKQ